jgi:hypothetical protein
MGAMQKLIEELRTNRRLQLGLVAIALVVLVDRALAWSDSLDARRQALAQVQIEVATLKSQARNEAAMQTAMRDIRAAAALADARLWVVSSEAVGQARLRDWLIEQIKLAGAGNYTVNVASPKPVVAAVGAELAAATDSSSSAPAPSGGLLEYSAALTFTLTPESLEKMLTALEAGDAMSKLESLSVRRNDRRVELAVRMLMRVKEEAQ